MAEITKIQLKTKTSKNANGLWLKADKSCTCKLNTIDIYLDTNWKRIEDTSGTSFSLTNISDGAEIHYYVNASAPAADTAGTKYTSTVNLSFGKLLSEVNLDLGEALVDTNSKSVIISTMEDGKAAGVGAETIILGASKTELGTANNNSVTITHKDAAGDSSYTLKTQGATLSEDNNTITIDATPILSKSNSNNKTTITLTPKAGTASSVTIDDPAWNNVIGRPSVYQVNSEDDRKKIADPKHLDICIVTSQINKLAGAIPEHNSYKGYVYNSSLETSDKWVAFDGNYDATNVFLPTSITVGGTKVGNASIGTEFKAGTSIQKVLETIMIGTRTINTDVPKATWGSITSAYSGEVGDTYNKPSVSLTVTVGEYKNAKKPETSTDTGVKYEKYVESGTDQTAGIKINVTDTDNSSNSPYKNEGAISSKQTITYTPDTYNSSTKKGTYKDTSCTYTFTAKAIHTAGSAGLPVNDKGEVESSKAIKAATLTPSDLDVTYTGYRYAFINVLNLTEYNNLKSKFNKINDAPTLSSIVRQYSKSRNVNNSLSSEGVTVPSGGDDTGDSARKYAVALVPESWKFNKLKCQLWNSSTKEWDDQTDGEVSCKTYNSGTTTQIGGADASNSNIGKNACAYRLFEYQFSNGLQSNIDKIRFVVTELEA